MSEASKRILILFAHPSQHRSEVNLPLFENAAGLPQVTLVDLYREYPNFHINIEREQQRLIEHDVLVFLFPMYWYSTPSILKEWQDLVLEYGFAYGKDGVALHGKQFICVLTAGGGEKAYHADGYNHFTLRELLQPLEQTAFMTGMDYLPPLALFGARTASEEGRVPEHIALWKKLLAALSQQHINSQQVSKLNTLNEYIASLEGTHD
jgi:putative NADPH-quinone reductase